MKKIWKPVLFFVICLFVLLAINMPLALMLEQFTLPNNIKLNGVQGRLHSGKINAIYVNRFPVEDVNYRVDLSCLLTLQICYQIDYLNGRGNISFNPLTHTATIRQLNVDYSMTELAVFMNQLLVKPTGELRLEINQIKIKQNKISNIEGLAIWSNAGIEGEDISLGDYQLSVFPDAESYRFELIDRDATLDIEGKGRLKSNGQYLFDINIVAKSDLDSRVKSILALVAQKKGLNDYVVQRQGQLQPQLINQVDFSDID